MAWRDAGNQAVESSVLAVTSNPTTSALLAEIDATQLGSTAWPRHREYMVTWVCGASSLASFRLDQALSTGLGSTAIRSRTVVFTGANQSAQFVLPYTLEPSDRLRVTVDSSFTGNAFVKIKAEPLV